MKNRPENDRLVGQDLLPLSRESGMVRGILRREGSHTVCLRVHLLLEKDGKVSFAYLPQLHIITHRLCHPTSLQA
jgi:hypothetical protein